MTEPLDKYPWGDEVEEKLPQVKRGPKPVAYHYYIDDDEEHPVLTETRKDWHERYPYWHEKPLYDHPREWKDLKHKEIAEILCDDRWQGRPELMLLRMQEMLKERNS